jgi:hypothetical protein
MQGAVEQQAIVGPRRGESVSGWAERAIVARSLAVAQVEELAGVGNELAQRIAAKRAAEAEAERDAALGALERDRLRDRAYQRAPGA